MARKILLADDSVTAQNMGRKILADAGYEVITVNNGSAALKKIAEQKPDLIVLDVYMPGYSGLEVCQRLKEVPETARIPVLLTVGKLEPFKPEEAKRVRAEGYIVKPFEASELLSTLSRLEDKIVPRSESSKGGRFARAIAAVEEAGHNENEPADEESGWKSRISFPKKKKKQEEVAEDGDDPAIYNAVNKDLRTVIPHEDASKASATTPQGASAHLESTADVRAGAPDQFPKDTLPSDVTLEEIAAIAAAAAQVQAAAAASKDPGEIPQVKASDQTKKEEAQPQDTEAAVEPAAKAESSIEDQAPSATFADVKREAEADAIVAEKLGESKMAPSEHEVNAAISALEGATAGSFVGSGNGNHPASSAEAPVTMASATAVGTPLSGPRWTAVAVALDAMEASASLEEEMKKAQTTVAVVQAEQVTAVAEAPAEPAQAEAVPAPVSELDSNIDAVPRASAEEEVRLAEALSTAANAVAATSATAAALEEPIPSSSEVTTGQAVAAEELRTAQGNESALEPVPAKSDPVEPESTIEDAPKEDSEKHEPLAASAVPPSPVEAMPSSSPHEPQHAEPGSVVAEAPHAPAVGGRDDMAEKREKELAAAWASWRQIRNTGDAKPEAASSANIEDAKSSFSESAAMAVAAGAENAPEEAKSASQPNEIADIVDSVLADLKPKIVEEIAKKLAKK